MTANSNWRSRRRASRPDEAVTTFSPSSDRSADIARRLSALSSMTRMLTRSSALMRSPMEPRSQNREHLIRVHGFREIVPGAGLERLFAVSLHRFGRDGDDGQRAQP